MSTKSKGENMGKGKGNSDSVRAAFDTVVGCAQVIGTVIGAIALIVSCLGFVWAITHQEAAIQVVQTISGVPTATPTVIIFPTDTPSPTDTPYPTHTPYPTYTPYIVPTPEPTEALPTPTPVVVVVTATATPSPTSPPQDQDTKPGTTLAPGDPWREEGVIAVLKKVDIHSDGVELELAFQNDTGQTIAFEWNFDVNVLVRDNSGNVYVYWGGESYRRVSLDDGETINLFRVKFKGPVYQQDVTKITLTIRNISRIDEATWEIPIYH